MYSLTQFAMSICLHTLSPTFLYMCNLPLSRLTMSTCLNTLSPTSLDMYTQYNILVLTVYTQSGPYSCHHLEYRCISCSKGFFHGYSTEVEQVELDDGDSDDEGKRRYTKLYEEDCLENEVRPSNIIIVYKLFSQILVTSRKTAFSVKYLYEKSLDLLYLYASIR